ncbi:translation initiation factor IF-3 [Coxiella endosymbiont of Ornithodoros amblus]|uniref:translation initiation factor IF-3 n=1 Tax=Coxiella endosymbiont of Ornithodoros amblus TaxID=1656166 RepID=UPI00244E2F00|nr:translation initiation factor IF-3 [Coxiella endosymbiont of Ornithodoros amblus]MBW5802904.1 translation initiation factor IF-3 [Coxiella endosymbiont of Ornithodoros amblus]
MRSKRTRVNNQIRVPEVRLIDEKGEQVGVLRTDRALTMAEEAGLDLVEISPTAKPSVCRIMNFGKYQFEQSKRKAAQKKKQRLVHLKEVKFRPGTDVGDYQVKLRKIATFLNRGDKVKVSLRFRGREMQHRELGLELLGRVKRDLRNITNIFIVTEQEPRLEGRQMTMVIMKAKAEGNKTKREDHAEIKD